MANQWQAFYFLKCILTPDLVLCGLLLFLINFQNYLQVICPIYLVCDAAIFNQGSFRGF